MSIDSRSGTSFSQENITKEADYLIDHVGDALQRGLTAIQTYKPKDPIEYLARYLYKYVDNMKCRKQLEIDAENLQREILEHEEEIRLQIEREEERKRIQIEEEESRKAKELEENQRIAEEEARLKAEEEERIRAEKEAEEASKALLEQSAEVNEEQDGLNENAVEDGKLPPVVETDEYENSTREATKALDENEEDNTIHDNIDNNENPDDQAINEDLDE